MLGPDRNVLQGIEYIGFQYSKAFKLLESGQQAHDNGAGMRWINLCLKWKIQIHKI